MNDTIYDRTRGDFIDYVLSGPVTILKITNVIIMVCFIIAALPVVIFSVIVYHLYKLIAFVVNYPLFNTNKKN